MLYKIKFPGLFIIVLALFGGRLKAQDSCVYLFTIPQIASFVTADHLANAYLLHDFDVEKYDSTGKFVTRYSNNRLGRPAFLDATNPLKMLVWYQDFQTAVFLDRNMTELGRLNVGEAGYPAVRSLASSSDGNLWAYDEASSYLFKLSASGEKLLESQPLNLEFSRRFAPTCIRDDGGQAVIISDPSQGIVIFNPFAQPDKTLLIKGLSQFEVENGLVFFIEKQQIRIDQWRGMSTKFISIPIEVNPELHQNWISKRRLFIQVGSGVQVYGF